MKQTDMILEHLRMYGSISSYDAFRKGVTRLSARIFDLKAKGIPIESETVRYKANNGIIKHYKVYRLGEK